MNDAKECGFNYSAVSPWWRRGFVGGYQFEETAARILDAYAAFFFYATGVTPPPNTPVANFWSVILYDNQTRSMLQTDQHWPAVSSQTKGLVVNPDSSVDLYFGPVAPKGKEHN
jgi:hypothetical protein